MGNAIDDVIPVVPYADIGAAHDFLGVNSTGVIDATPFAPTD